MPDTATSGATVFTCPLSSCRWTQADLQAEGAGYIGMLATEQLLREHLSSHDLTEWVAEVVNLHDVMVRVVQELGERGRIGHSLLTGAMATRANLAREECIEWIGHAIKGDADG